MKSKRLSGYVIICRHTEAFFVTTGTARYIAVPELFYDHRAFGQGTAFVFSKDAKKKRHKLIDIQGKKRYNKAAEVNLAGRNQAFLILPSAAPVQKKQTVFLFKTPKSAAENSRSIVEFLFIPCEKAIKSRQKVRIFAQQFTQKLSFACEKAVERTCKKPHISTRQKLTVENSGFYKKLFQNFSFKKDDQNAYLHSFHKPYYYYCFIITIITIRKAR